METLVRDCCSDRLGIEVRFWKSSGFFGDWGLEGRRIFWEEEKVFESFLTGFFEDL